MSIGQRPSVTPSSWPCPLPGGSTCDAYALQADSQSPYRLLIVPALFNEGNTLRRFTVDVMRRLSSPTPIALDDTAPPDGESFASTDASSVTDSVIDCFLPDFPGCNESVQMLFEQDPTDWLDAMSAAARHFGATHVLGMRGGCLFTPEHLPSMHYAPVRADAVLRQMLRARILASREAGITETREALAQEAMKSGIVLSGYDLSADFYLHFENMEPNPEATLIAQEDVGGAGLWLRAEPDADSDQADALARIVRAHILKAPSP